MTKTINKTSPKVLGLDVSTKTIGWSLFDIQTKELLELTHISPVPKPKVENKIEELILKGHIFGEKIRLSWIPITIRFPSSPNFSKNELYSMLAFSDAGSKLASVLVNFMYFHWEAIKRVKRATNTNKPILEKKFNI